MLHRTSRLGGEYGLNSLAHRLWQTAIVHTLCIAASHTLFHTEGLVFSSDQVGQFERRWGHDREEAPQRQTVLTS